MKTVMASACFDAHEDDYCVAISPVLVQSIIDNLISAECYLWNSRTPLPGEFGTVRHLRLTPPSWTIQSELGRFDSTLVAPTGEWKNAGHYLPLLEDTSGAIIVVRIDDCSYPVGWLRQDELRACLSKEGSPDDGVIPLNINLNHFLNELHPLDANHACIQHPAPERSQNFSFTTPGFLSPDLWLEMEASLAALTAS